MPENQPRDEHAKQLKQSISLTKQLRGWVASDPSRTEDFVDALNRMTGLRLLSALWTEAAPEATEAVTWANRLVASRGPVGPYTPLADAARYFTALVHVARIQLGLGLAEAAGTTVEAAHAWADQLTSSGLAEHLAPETLIQALDVRAHASLAAGDIARANAMADAALVLARQSGLAGDATPVLLDALRTVADARWAAQLPDESIDRCREAIAVWEAWTHDDLQQLPRMAKAHLERVVAPALGMRRDLAGRLLARGRGDEALAVHEELTRLEHRTASRRGEPGRLDLAAARAAQVWDLTTLGHTDAALRAAEDASGAMNALLKAEKPVGVHLPTQLVVASAVARAELAAGRAAAASASIEGVHSRLRAHHQVSTPVAARAVALQVRASVQEAQGDQAASASRAESDQLVAELRDGLPEAYRDLGTAELLASCLRGAQLRSTWPTPHWDVVPASAMLEPQGAQPVVDESLSDEEALRRIDEQREREAAQRIQEEMRATAERQEKEREQAQVRAAALAELERRRALEAEREAAERAEAEAAAAAARAETESRADEDEAEAARLAAEQAARQEREDREREEREAAERARQEQARQEEARREQERQAREAAEREAHERQAQERQAQQRAEQERLAAERAAAEREAQARRQADPLDELRTAAHRALASGDRHRIIETHEALVAVLEPRAVENPTALARELVEALEHLADAQGWLRGRSARGAAKQYARQWGLT